jgi:hypothetical protein
LNRFTSHELQNEQVVRGRKFALGFHLRGDVGASGMQELKKPLDIIGGAGVLVGIFDELRNTSQNEAIENTSTL